jgi:hypothetical protein
MLTVGKDYRHFKGTSYIVVCLACDAETQEPMVIYTTGDTKYWVRSRKNFEEEVVWPDGVTRPRFIPVEPTT